MSRAILFPLVLLLAGLAAPAAAAETASSVPRVGRTYCADHDRAQHGGATVEQRFDQMQVELRAAQHLLEEALAFRAEAIVLHDELQAKVERGEPLSGRDLQRLNSGAVALLAQRRRLFELAFAHECWLHATPPADRRDADLQAAGIAMSLAAALTLYDNYLSAISLYRNNHALRQHLNRPDSGFALQAGELNKAGLMFSSAGNRKRVRRAITWFEQHGRRDTSAVDGYAYLTRLIEQSPSYQLVRQQNPLRALGEHFEVFSLLTIDLTTMFKDEGSGLSSLLFGNAIGLVETRRGKLHGRRDVVETAQGVLRAGDILVEKTPFRLTDTFIPGHWGHAAIWIGSEAELRDLGIWDHPVVRPYQTMIRAGHGVVEALRSGVKMNRFEHFLNIDDLGVLRPHALSAAQRAEAVLQTLRQVGKAYDFNFDAETTDRVFCSKLVYLAFGDLQWPTSRMMGRATVTPDNIASRALDGGPLTLVLLYHDGKQVAEAPEARMKEWLRAPKRLARAGGIEASSPAP